MHLNPESLSFALLILDLGSIARAANILGMKQATLSRKLMALESRVGVRLFGRSTRGAVPTVSGAGFLNQARRIVADRRARARRRREAVGRVDWRKPSSPIAHAAASEAAVYDHSHHGFEVVRRRLADCALGLHASRPHLGGRISKVASAKAELAPKP
jgi:DNA-binding transcriptional LysR family regulator